MTAIKSIPNLVSLKNYLFICAFFPWVILLSLQNAATAYAESAPLSWNAVYAADLEGYVVYWSTTSINSADFTGYEECQAVGDVTSFEITGLEPGQTYYLAVTAMDLAGQESDFSDEISYTTSPPIENQPPVALASTDVVVGQVPLLVNFDASDSYDPDGNIISYNWTFGDGESSDEIYPSHTYVQPGIYTVQLTVTDSDETTGTTALEIVVIEEIPEVAINFQPSNAEVPEGFLPDSGYSYDEERGYGWNGRGWRFPVDRNSSGSPDQQHDTVMYIYSYQQWEMAVPNGTYEVTVSIGDAGRSIYRQNVQAEGQTVFKDARVARGCWIEETVTVEVTDGKLTLTFRGGRNYIRANYVVVKLL
ncbi:MAG: PKD domain-containing protein [Deltaproteobacteria bacterium]|nr:PKD domain-containing protein [Deltaproteobacteria bacterium]